MARRPRGTGLSLGLFTGSRAFHMASPEIFRRLCFALIAASVLTSLPVWR